MSATTITLKLSPELAEQTPRRPEERVEIFSLGLKQMRIKKALEEYQRGECSLAYAASQAGVTLRQMISFAYAYGLEPHLPPHLEETTSLESASRL